MWVWCMRRPMCFCLSWIWRRKMRAKCHTFLFPMAGRTSVSAQQGRSMYHCWMFLMLVCHTVSVCPDPKGSATRAPVDAKEIRAPQGHLHCHSFGVAPESRGNVNAARRPLKRPPQIHRKPAAAEASTEEPQAHRGPRTTAELWYLSPAQHNTELNSLSSTWHRKC